MFCPGCLTNVAAQASAGGGYDAASVAFFAAMSVQPDDVRKGQIDTFVRGVKADGVWPLLDAFYLIAAHDAQAALVDLVAPASLLVANGVVTNTVDRGAVSDGTSGYFSGRALNAGPNLSLNSATVGIYVNVAGNFNNAVGVPTAVTFRLNPNNNGSAAVRLNSATQVTGPVSDTLGLTTAVRPDANTVTVYRGATQIGQSTANASTSLATDNVYILRSGSAYSTSRVAAAFYGGAMTGAQVAALNTRLVTLLTAMGAN